MTFLTVKGQRFEALGPVDRRRSIEFTTKGLALCPSCLDGGRHVGTFAVNRYFLEHLRRDHYRCTQSGCGWVGVVPGQHVARARNHRGPVATTRRPAPPPIRISDLHG